jgi:hypothetical protein
VAVTASLVLLAIHRQAGGAERVLQNQWQVDRLHAASQVQVDLPLIGATRRTRRVDEDVGVAITVHVPRTRYGNAQVVVVRLAGDGESRAGAQSTAAPQVQIGLSPITATRIHARRADEDVSIAVAIHIPRPTY